MKTAIALRHLAFEDAGLLAPLLHARGYALRYHEAGLDAIDGADAADLLIVLGGPIGAFDDAAYPFLRDELALIERRLAEGRPLLGICLGAQLMARALGARVTPMAAKEIGFAPVSLTEAGLRSPLAALRHGTPVLHWHGDRFEIPLDAQRLAGSAHCAEQAFALGTQALALQFHLEADPARLESWLIGHACELAAAGIDPRTLRTQAHEHGAALAEAGRAVLGAWLDGLETR